MPMWIIGTWICLLCIGIWCLIERQLLVIRRYTLPLKELPTAFCGFRIVQLSDLHKRVMGKQDIRLIHAVQKCCPDIIVITGDLISRDVTDFTQRKQLLTALRKIAPVYLCMGNHELDLQSSYQEQYRKMIVETGCILLENTMIHLHRKKEICYLAGASLRIGVYHDVDFTYAHLESYSEADLTADLGQRQGFTILLAHNPFLAETYFDWGADLTLTGHVHGGVIRLPFAGGLLSPERCFFPKYSKGLQEHAGKWMYVNCGIGKLRLGNPAEIACFTLQCT